MSEAAMDKKRRRAPKGYEKKNSDPVGYWTEDEPIHFIPRSAKLIDGTRVKERPSIMIVGELVEKTVVALKDGDPFEANVGDIVSVWYKPGMRDIAKNGNIKVWLDKDIDDKTGEQRTKPTKNGAMKLYTVDGEPGKKGILIPISEDSRQKSIAASTPFDDPNLRPVRRAPPKTETMGEGHEDEDQVDDQIPF